MEKQIEIVIKEFALHQLKEEYDYFKTKHSLFYAEEFRLDFFKKIYSIVPFYKSFPECRFLRTKKKIYRNVVWENYLIVFKIKPELIEILTLFHTKQNPKRLKKLRRIK
ncbi:MAG TPA: hypothetical protein VJY62_12850 [Bacteroidia bacterium]|nr:hypothetical protein [Bacteroidia bacterium]